MPTGASRADQKLIEEIARLKQRIQDLERSTPDRKRAEEALRTSEATFRYLFDRSPVGKSLTLPSGDVQVNSAFCSMLGLSAEELKGKTWQEFTHPDDIELTQREMDALLTGQRETTRFTKRFLAKDGSVVWADVSSSLRRDSAGAPMYFMTAFNDISVRVKAEEVQRESEKRFRDITFSMGDWVWEVDQDGVYTYSSPKGIELFGDAIGKTPFDFMPPDEARRVAAAFSKIAARRAPIEDLENWNVTKSGDLVCLLTNGVPILDADGTFRGYRGVDRDITNRKRAEEERADLEAQLQQAQKLESVGRLAGGVAHDFNNMLGVIIGHAEMAMDEIDPTSPVHADLAEIRAAASRSAELTRQLLAFARKQTVAPKVVDLNAVVTGAVKMLRRLIGEQIALDWRPGPELWPVKVDPSQIEQVLANLCINARDAIAGIGTIVIETKTAILTRAECTELPGVVPGQYVRLVVSDSGRGMDADTLAHIFEPFFTTKGVGEGTGLGLAMVYGAVHQNRGAIRVQSVPGVGTTFLIYVPRYVGPAEQVSGEDAAPATIGGHETILVVEDEPTLLKIITAQLERQGYTVLAASSPGAALELATAHAGQFQLVISDVVMPQMDGRTLVQKLVAMCPTLKCVFMSGYTADLIAHHGVVDDGVSFIQKPFSLTDLAARVREMLDRK